MVREVSIDKRIDCPADRSEFVWIGGSDPTDAEMRTLQARYSLHPLMVGGLGEVLTSVFEFSNLMEQQRTGVIPRQLVAWAAILAVPTAIAGICGMNFNNIPELKTRYGYFVILGIMFIVCGALYARFKRARWL